MAINAILSDASAIDTIEEVQWNWHKDGERLWLTGVPAGTRVELYDLRGTLISKVISDGSDIMLRLYSNQLHVLKVGGKAIKL